MLQFHDDRCDELQNASATSYHSLSAKSTKSSHQTPRFRCFYFIIFFCQHAIVKFADNRKALLLSQVGNGEKKIINQADQRILNYAHSKFLFSFHSRLCDLSMLCQFVCIRFRHSISRSISNSYQYQNIYISKLLQNRLNMIALTH